MGGGGRVCEGKMIACNVSQVVILGKEHVDSLLTSRGVLTWGKAIESTGLN